MKQIININNRSGEIEHIGQIYPESTLPDCGMFPIEAKDKKNLI